MGQEEIDGLCGESCGPVAECGTGDCKGLASGPESDTDSAPLVEPEEIIQHCKGCCFQSEGEPCSLGRLERFRQLHPESVRSTVDGEYSIHGRYCKAFRPRVWSMVNEGADLHQLVREEITIKVGVVVPITDEDIARKGAWGRLISSILKQSLRPAQVMFVNGTSQSAQDIHKVLWAKLGANLTWRVVHPFEGEKTIPALLDLGVSRFSKDITHYAVFCPNRRVPPDHLQRVDEAVNDKLEKLACLIPPRRSAPSGLVVQKNVWHHPWVNGFAPVEYQNGEVVTDIIEKLRRFRKASGTGCESYRTRVGN